MADARDVAAEERLLNEPLYQALRAPLLDFVRRLQLAETAADWFELHRALLIEFWARQEAMEETLKAAKTKVSGQIAELARQDPRPLAELRDRQQILERIRMQELVARANQHTLRQVGDGIAWKALGYDRRAMTILGEGERVGRLASGIGLQAELGELGRLWEEEKVFALHNDLTNCLRHGDLTIVRTTSNVLDVTLAEIKAGWGSGQSPQLARLERATDLLRDGRRLDGERRLRVAVVPGAYETFLGDLPDLIASAREDGYAWVRPHACLVVGAVDYRVWGSDAANYSARSDAERRRVGWGVEEPETVGWTASLRRMRDRSTSLSVLAPFTIYPLAAEDVTDLVLGFIDLAFCLHLPRLESALTDRGISVRVSRPPNLEACFLEATRGAAGVRVPAHVRDQMLVELMSPTALLAELDHILTELEEDGDPEADSLVVAFAEERDVWEARPHLR